MSSDIAIYLAIAGMAAATALTRLGGMWLVRMIPLSGRLSRGLEALPPAVLMAVIAPTILATGPAEATAGAITALAATRLPTLATICVGVASVVALRAVLA